MLTGTGGSGQGTGGGQGGSGGNGQNAPAGNGGPGAGTTDPGNTGAGGAGPGGTAAGPAGPGAGSAGGTAGAGGSAPVGGSIWDECGARCYNTLWSISNFFAGAGDALTLGVGTRVARKSVSWVAGMGYGENVNYRSKAYWGGVATGAAGGIGLSGPRGPLFGTRFGGNTPLFNSNNYLRIGWSYLRVSGTYSFRIGGVVVGLIKSNPHINLWPPSMWFW
jgi:hypothetical protein